MPEIPSAMIMFLTGELVKVGYIESIIKRNSEYSRLGMIPHPITIKRYGIKEEQLVYDEEIEQNIFVREYPSELVIPLNSSENTYLALCGFDGIPRPVKSKEMSAIKRVLMQNRALKKETMIYSSTIEALHDELFKFAAAYRRWKDEGMSSEMMKDFEKIMAGILKVMQQVSK